LYSQDQLLSFEALIDGGQTSGFFDNQDLFDSVSVFCSFFQEHAYGFATIPSPYGHEMIRRFLNVFNGEKLPGFEDSKVETYFAAAYCAAAGLDLRSRLRYWGFTIDDAFYDQIMSDIEARLPEEPGLPIRRQPRKFQGHTSRQ
jgi:hypothetical protein